MNIKEAKDEVKNSMLAYFTKDNFGNYIIPIEKQRPIFLVGAPGIGKTAIMEQIAEELNVGLLSYSMTHHTRQSALGLPFISKKVYDGKEYDISEYTMSEIIASVYDMIEATGIREGILFLDEINCVSETLAPAMLQFLQFKIFGRHRVPNGWIVVTAGNPPEYNNSVREFDIVTLDRLKKITVEANYNVWKEYAVKQEIHPAITTYLDIKKDDFYRVETTVDGKSFATARGWDDLSAMIKVYEKRNIPVSESLIEQYLQHRTIAKSFAVYYDLFNKYRSDYQAESILNGTFSEEIIQRAQSARFDERLALLGLLLDGINTRLNAFINEENMLTKLVEILRLVKNELSKPGHNGVAFITKQINLIDSKVSAGKISGSMSISDIRESCGVKAVLEFHLTLLSQATETIDGAKLFEHIKTDYDKRLKDLKDQAAKIVENLENLFRFSEEAFDEGQEILILVTELTINSNSARFISRYGCERYYAHNKELLFHERHKELIREVEMISLN